VDETRLNQLFRDAVGRPPAASFDTGDVVGASRRVAARRRSALTGGSLLGVAVLTGGVLLGGDVLRPAPENPSAASRPAPEAGDRMLTPELMTPFLAPPGAAEAVGCAAVDAELAAALATALGTAGPAVPLPETCPPGTRAAGLPVPGGTVYALLGPTAPGPGAASLPVDGGVLTVVSVPADPAAAPPPVGDLDRLAREVADQL